MLLGQLFLAEERGGERLTALFCDTDCAGKCELAQREVKYIITVRKGHVGGEQEEDRYDGRSEADKGRKEKRPI